jgi:hypothetical protein
MQQLRIESWCLVDIVELAIDSYTHQTLGSYSLQDLFVLSATTAHHRRQQYQLGLLRKIEHPLSDLFRGLLTNRITTSGAPHFASSGVENSEIVVNFSQRADRAPRLADQSLLVYPQRRKQALDGIDIGPRQLLDELPSKQRKGFKVLALALGPVITVTRSWGKLSEMFLRLCVRAPATAIPAKSAARSSFLGVVRFASFTRPAGTIYSDGVLVD